MNRWFLDPLFRGEYPTDLPLYAAGASAATSRRSRRRSTSSASTTTSPRRRRGGNGRGLAVLAPRTRREYTDMGWEVYPDGLFECLVRVPESTRRRAIQSPRTAPRSGRPRHDASVRDPSGPTTSPVTSTRWSAPSLPARRCAATSSGRCWTTSSGSLGYGKRFGLVYVDFPTLERVPKSSFHWYRDFLSKSATAILASAAERDPDHGAGSA